MTDLDGDLAALARARLRHARAANSPGLARLAIRLAETQQSLTPTARPRRLLVFGAEGVSLPAAEATETQAVLVAGGEADASDTGACPSRAVLGRFATNVSVGARAAEEAAEAGVRVLALLASLTAQEVAAAEALVALLVPAAAEEVVSQAAEGGKAERSRRLAWLEERVRAADANPDRMQAIAALCPAPVAALAGAIVEARRAPLSVVIEGLSGAAAALVAREIDASSLDGLIPLLPRPQHPAQRLALRALGLEPFDLAGESADPLPALLALLDAAAARLASA